MTLTFLKVINRITYILFAFVVYLAFTSPAKANDLFIYYSNNESSQYSDLKSHYESLGFTVTGSTSGTVSSSDLSGKELVIDIAGTSNCGSTCKTNYESFIGSGGKLIIAVENGATNRQGNIESLIENKLAVGSMTYYSNWYNDALQSIRRGDWASSTSSENTLPGTDGVFTASGGTPMASNTTTSSWHNWYKWDYGSNGGSVMVTTGYGQFILDNHGANVDAFHTAIAEELGLYSSASSYTSSISSAQTTQINTARGVTHSGNGIYIDQVGDNNDLDVVQDGNDNLIAGVGSTTNSLIDADITGNNNTTTLKQKGNNNVMLFDITGNTNTTTANQGSTSGSDDNRLEFDINGNSNTTSITQDHNDGVGTNGHFLGLDLDGDNNNVLTSQLNDGDKKAFISVQGDDNNIDLYQQGTGSHYVEIQVGSDQTVDITQDGSGNHNASISMSGFDAGLDLTQDSSTDQTYSLSQNCNNANGCGTTTVTQN